jgi:hypothetical protein
MTRSPFYQFGYGIVTYFQFLKHIIKVYAVLSVLAVPIILVYFSAHGLFQDGIHVGKYSGGIISKSAYLTLGNLGFSGTKCYSQFNNLNAKQEIGCTVGYLANEYEHFGILPVSAANNFTIESTQNKPLHQSFCGD